MRRCAVVVVAVVLAALGWPPAAQAATPLDRLTGDVRLVQVDPIPGRADLARTDRVLVVGRRVLHIRSERALPANTRVSVLGRVIGEEVSVDSFTALGALDGPSSTGTTDVLVMLANWTSPDYVTPQLARDVVFGASNDWYREASYGQLGLRGDVTPWLSIAGPRDNKCYGDSDNVMLQAKDAATARGYDLGNYDDFVVYFPYAGNAPGQDCSQYTGWGRIGAADAWLNGVLNLSLVVHELGHNYGLFHSHSYVCTEVIVGDCYRSEYGDDFDIMGGGYSAHFNAAQKQRLGWIDNRVVDLTRGGTARLTPLEKTRGQVAARIGVVNPRGRLRVYWLEFRENIGFDALPPEATDGVLVHVEDVDINLDDGTSLLDARPGGPPSIYTATLRAGESWTTPEGVTIAVTAVQASGADVTVTSDAELPGGSFTGVDPARLLDTRTGLGAPSPGPATPGRPVVLTVGGRGGLPTSGVSAAVLNVTSTGADGGGFVTVYPSNVARPTTSNLNVVAGLTVANLVVVPVSPQGTVTLYPSRPMDLIADVTGWFSTVATASESRGLFHALTPTRLMDTRINQGGSTPGPGQTRQLTVAGTAGIPADAQAVVANVTAASPTAQGYVTAYPTGRTRPTTSSLNFAADDVRANRIVVPVGDGGQISLYNFAGRTPLVVDITGYFSGGAEAEQGSWYVPITPIRRTDTRTGSGTPLGAREVRSIYIDVNVPAIPPPYEVGGPVAVVANLTAVQPTTGGFLTAWPAARARPATSDVNFVPGQIVPNALLTGLDYGELSIYNLAGRTDVLLDISGFFTEGLFADAPAVATG